MFGRVISRGVEKRQPYPTDLTEQQWNRIGPLIPAVKPGGRPAKYPRREIVSAIFYQMRGGAQIWIAVSVYVLVAIVRKRLGMEASLYQILQILSVTLFEKTPILQAFQAPDSQDDLSVNANQLILFDF